MSQQDTKQYIFEHYRETIYISDQFNSFYNNFAEIKLKFSQYDNTIKSLTDDRNNKKY